MNILTNALIAVAAVGVVGYALMSHLQSRAPRPRATIRTASLISNPSPKPNSMNVAFYWLYRVERHVH